jgi:hypothetical protein
MDNTPKTNNNETLLLKKYIHDIRNVRVFSKDTLISINNLSYKDRLEILFAYNDMFEYFKNLLNEH